MGVRRASTRSAWRPLHYGLLALSFLGVLALCGRLGPLSGGLARALALVLIGAPVLHLLHSHGRRAGWTSLLCVALGWGALLLAMSAPEWWRPGFVATGFGFWSVAPARDGDRSALRRLGAGCALFSSVLPWFDAFPPLMALLGTWSGIISSVASGATGLPVSAGPSALGFESPLLLLCIVGGAAVCRPHSAAIPWRALGLALLAGQALTLAWALALAVLPGFPSPLQLSPAPTADPLRLLWRLWIGHLPLWGPWLVAVPLAALLPPLLPRFPMPESPQPRPAGPRRAAWSRRLALLGAVALIGFAGGAASWLAAPRAARGRTVVLYENGFLNWLRPGFEHFGRESGGMFGMLPAFIESLGLHARRTAVIDSAALHGASVLFLANLENPLSEGERGALWNFVRSGGHLLVLGDHTWLRGHGGNPLNTVLEPCAIRYRIDSANFFTGGWGGGFRFPLDPLTAGLSPDDNAPAIVVGASLEIGPGARPLLFGRWGYSDAAALADSVGGHLGDLAYTPGEHVGDLALIATQGIGEGRVTVLGDTSPFFNGIMCSSYPFVSRLLLWAAAPSQDPPFRLFLLDSLLALVVGLLLARHCARPHLALLAAAAAGATLGWAGYERQTRWPDPFVSGNLAFVDVSHLPLVHVGDWDEEAIMGLPIGLMRFGYSTYFLHRLDDPALDRARLLFLVAPRRKLATREADRILEWVDRGGTLVFAVGAEEAGQSRPLLERLGVRIRPVPLGNIVLEGPRGPVHSAEAWAIEWDARAEEDAQVLMRYGEYPIAVGLRVGKGRVALIGDSQFFANFNLEHGEHAHPPNVAFLAYLAGATVPEEFAKEGTPGH